MTKSHEYMHLIVPVELDLRGKLLMLNTYAADGWEYDGDIGHTDPSVVVRLLRREVEKDVIMEDYTTTLDATATPEKQYEYTTAYLLEHQAANINEEISMMNSLGENGWCFTGYAKKVVNGTFYFFARVASS